MGSNKEFVDSIKNLIAMSEVDKAIDLFRDHNLKEFEKEIIGFSSRYHNLLKEIRQDTIKREDANIERNKICVSMLEIADQIDINISPSNSYRLNKELEDVLALAETQSRRNGEAVTSTKYFFAALVKLHPLSLIEILTDLERMGAMPSPISEEVASLPRLFSKSRPLSACLTDTATEMNKVVNLEEPIRVEEFFVDVAKFGKGSSVNKLRKHGIDVPEIEKLVDKYDINIRDRKIE